MTYFISLLATIYCSCLFPVQVQEKSNSNDGSYYAAQLQPGELLRMENKTIEFKKVLNDSRCPKGIGITCVWEGNVKVLLGFYEDGKSRGSAVVTKNDLNLVNIFNSGTLHLTTFEVTPYPGADQKICPEDYELNLEVQLKPAND